MSIKPLCFVLMPFGKKDDPTRPGQQIDFETLYFGAIKPGIEDAGLDPVRAKEEATIGVIHKAMFERLLLCDFAVAEITVPNPNVFYELGVRHASRNHTTLPIFAHHTQPPFDVALLRALPYELGPANEVGDIQLQALRRALADRLKQLRELAYDGVSGDSPVFEFVGKTQQSNLPLDDRLRRLKQADGALYELLDRYGGHDKTDVFRDVVSYNDKLRKALTEARALKPKAKALAELTRIENDLLPFDDVEAAVLVDLYLSYRALSAFTEMVKLYDGLPRSLRRSVLMREQRAFALNRLAGANEADRPRRAEAVQLLRELINEVGANPETNGLLGRVFKDQWQEALVAAAEAEKNDKKSDARALRAEARGHLTNAIDAYRTGFEADYRDAYPGVNAVTLLDVQGDPEALKAKDRLLPIVKFAVERRIAAGQPDYWDLATLLELAILADDVNGSRTLADRALAAVRESWEAGTTAKNLSYIANARRERALDPAWLEDIIADLRHRAGE